MDQVSFPRMDLTAPCLRASAGNVVALTFSFVFPGPVCSTWLWCDGARQRGLRARASLTHFRERYVRATAARD